MFLHKQCHLSEKEFYFCFNPSSVKYFSEYASYEFASAEIKILNKKKKQPPKPPRLILVKYLNVFKVHPHLHLEGGLGLKCLGFKLFF